MAQTEREKQMNDALYNTALSAMQNQEKPQYAGTFEGQLNDIYEKIQNREPFSYDVNADPLYQSYKDQYIQQGKLAMKDTMGQAAALTGGYGNTYGQQVGQQAYDAYLQNLSAAIPQLYGMAYDKYKDQGDDLKDLYALAGQQRDQEYGRYRDELSDWNYNQDLLRQMEQQEYNRRMDEESIARQLEQQEYERRIYDEEVQRKIEQQNYQKQQQEYANLLAVIKATGYMPTDAELQAAGMSRDQAAALVSEFNRQLALEDLANEMRYSSGGGGGGGSSSRGGGYSGSYYDDYDYGYNYDETPAASTSKLSSIIAYTPETKSAAASYVSNKKSSVFDTVAGARDYARALAESGKQNTSMYKVAQDYVTKNKKNTGGLSQR